MLTSLTLPVKGDYKDRQGRKIGYYFPLGVRERRAGSKGEKGKGREITVLTLSFKGEYIDRKGRRMLYFPLGVRKRRSGIKGEEGRLWALLYRLRENIRTEKGERYVMTLRWV